MRINKNIVIKICSMALVLVLVLSGCGSGNADNGDSQVSEAVEVFAENTAKESADTNYQVYTDKKIDSSYDESSCISIELSGTTASCDDSSVEVENGSTASESNSVTITQEGDYILSGDYTGSIIITVPETDDIRLILNNVELKGDKNAAIYCTQGDDFIIILADGSENTIEDADEFTYSDETNEEPDAALFSKIDLAITGSGTLKVTANYNNGIGTKDDLVISEGTYSITAANHGIRGRDSVSIESGVYEIFAAADGIQSNNNEDETKGWISIESGTFDITSGNDGIQAETALAIYSGEFNILSGGGSGAAVADATESYKGVKAAGALYIDAGAFEIDSADDALHSNLDIDIEGGTYTLSTGDDGMHADNDMIVNPESINVITCYEGIESNTMTINGGTIDIYATDDGINISGGNDTGTEEGQFGGDTFRGGGGGGQGVNGGTPPDGTTEDEAPTAPEGTAEGEAPTTPEGTTEGEAPTTPEGTTEGAAGDTGEIASSSQWLIVNDGTINITANSDCVDVNGNAEINGGMMTLTSVISDIEVAIDCDGTFAVNGGELVATAGYSNMTQGVSEASEQTSMLIVYDSNQTAGNTVTITDESGNTVYEYTPSSDFRTILICSSNLEQNNTYSLSTGGNINFETTLTTAVTNLSENGEAISVNTKGMPGGGAQGGGMM